MPTRKPGKKSVISGTDAAHGQGEAAGQNGTYPDDCREQTFPGGSRCDARSCGRRTWRRCRPRGAFTRHRLHGRGGGGGSRGRGNGRAHVDHELDFGAGAANANRENGAGGLANGEEASVFALEAGIEAKNLADGVGAVGEEDGVGEARKAAAGGNIHPIHHDACRVDDLERPRTRGAFDDILNEEPDSDTASEDSFNACASRKLTKGYPQGDRAWDIAADVGNGLERGGANLGWGEKADQHTALDRVAEVEGGVVDAAHAHEERRFLPDADGGGERCNAQDGLALCPCGWRERQRSENDGGE